MEGWNMPRSFPVLLVILGILHALEAGAGRLEVDPFYTRDQGPFAQIFGLPPAEGGKLVPPRGIDIRLVFDASSVDSGGWELPRETLELDGESCRVTFALRYGLPGRTEIGLDIPYVAHSEGVLDGFIENFHRAAGLDTSQKSAGKYRLVYSYIRDGVPMVDIRDRTSGVGDVLLSFGYPVYRSGSPEPREAAVRAGVKLPTGNAEALRGSGGADFSLRLAGTDPATLADGNITIFGTAGVLFPGEGSVLGDQVRRFVGFGSMGLGWLPLDRLALKIQMDARTAFFRESDSVVLASPAIHLVGGGAFSLPWDVTLDVALSEPIVWETSPDVTFHVALRKRL
jgi:hypothetical protein